MSSQIKAVRAQKIVEKFLDPVFYDLQARMRGVLIDDYVKHYAEIGWREGWDPCKWFSTESYLKSDPELLQNGINPLAHYIAIGKKQNRSVRQSLLCENATDLLGADNAICGTADSSDTKQVAVPASDMQYLENGDTLGVITTQRPATAVASRPRDIVGELFDEAFYKANNPDIAAHPDPFSHFMEYGWREWRDPSANFKTGYYLTMYDDIRQAGVNPLIHYLNYGQKEGRYALPYTDRRLKVPFTSLVSVIVPNYNHARYLIDRVESIANQTYTNIELLLLDDASSDNSVDVINSILDRYSTSLSIKAIFNESNSGNVFKQWRRGLEACSGEYVWICESDDICENDFLEKVLTGFIDSSVMLSFGRIQFCNKDGLAMPGLDDYRESAQPGIWDQSFSFFANELFCNGFARANLVPNVGGCVFRKSHLSDAVWAEALTYRVCGDWYLYTELANCGRVSYVPDAVAYFRQHGQNTSVSSFQTAQYYREHQYVLANIMRRWPLRHDVVIDSYKRLAQQFTYAKAATKLGSIAECFSLDELLRTKHEKRHILICSLGFHLGGGELFPIHLANQLVRNGWMVSFFCLTDVDEKQSIRQRLDNSVPVYYSQMVAEMGIDAFIRTSGITLINSHNVGVEFFFFRNNKYKSDIPYIVTLHGSYDVTPIPDDLLITALRKVSHWVYLSPKNLGHFGKIPVCSSRLSQIFNGMPTPVRTMSEVNTAKQFAGDFIVTLVSRAIPEKGWNIAAKAVAIARQKTGVDIRLLLVGDGPCRNELQIEHEQSPFVSFLGLRDDISEIYMHSDVCVLPTRFSGESHPLTLIEALQCGTPVIATDIGEIRSMLFQDSQTAGILVRPTSDDDCFSVAFADAIASMLDNTTRHHFKQASVYIAKRFSIESCTMHYENIFNCYPAADIT